jgi:glycosyltransferase involved in cell wall biosynthesis
MPLKRVGILLPSLGIYGGVNIALNWAAILAKSGYHLDLIVSRSSSGGSIPFLCEEDARLLHVISDGDARGHHYHAVLATIWTSIPHLLDLDVDYCAWFMQAYEGQFLDLNDPRQADFDELLAAEINVITTAYWLQQHILRHYSFEPKQTFCVISGLDKALWKPVPRDPLGRGNRPVRFLVEGPTVDPRKNVAQTVRLLEQLGVRYKWVGSAVDAALVGPSCDGVLGKVPYQRMRDVYGWADVLVKASNSEGMFGPPLEMFATGGTAAVWHVQGAEEYMSDRYNALLVPMNSWPRLAEAVIELADAPDLVRSLQENALATAEAWPTWEDQAEEILGVFESLVPFGRSSLVRHVAKNQFRSILHAQPVLEVARRAEAEAQRAARAEAELERMTNSRAWRVVRLLQCTRRRLAPDGSRRWSIIRVVGRTVWRAGRRIRALARSA